MRILREKINRNIFLLFLLFSVLLVMPAFACYFMPNADVCNFFNSNDYRNAISMAIHLAFVSIAMFFLWKNSLHETADSIGFPGKAKSVVVYTCVGLIVIFIVLFAFTFISSIFDFNDQDKVFEKVTSLPVYLLFFAIVLAPITEELFFRAFLTPRIGIIFSSLLFGILHASYGSVVEIGGAAIIGAVLAVVFTRSKSITPCILIHMIYNLISILVMVYVA